MSVGRGRSDPQDGLLVLPPDAPLCLGIRADPAGGLAARRRRRGGLRLENTSEHPDVWFGAMVGKHGKNLATC